MRPIIAALLLALLLASGCAVAQRGEPVTAGPAARAAAAAPTITATVIPTIWNIEVTTVPHVVEIRVPAAQGTRDFVSLVAPGSPQTVYTFWKYTSAAKAGVLTFEGVKPGTYEARLFSLTGAAAPAPGKLIDAKTVIVPVPKPRPVEIDNPNGKVVITRRATDSAGDVMIKIKEDQSLIEVLADKTESVTVKQVKP